jgi:hypothetical protein
MPRSIFVLEETEVKTREKFMDAHDFRFKEFTNNCFMCLFGNNATAGRKPIMAKVKTTYARRRSKKELIHEDDNTTSE